MNQNVTPSIFSVGIDDPNVQLFEQQYKLTRGMSYNSYAIIDRQIAVVDSVEAGHADQWLRQISEATDGSAVDYLIVQHMEPDHSACIMEAVDRWPGLKIVTTAKSAAMLAQFFPQADLSDRIQTVKEGDTLQLGDHTLRFIMAPMVHWPEVMVTYDETDKVLFSADAFGKFGAVQYPDDWVSEARRYYINIVGKYGAQVQALLRKLQEPAIRTIAPLHGPVLRENLAFYVDLYHRWSRYEPECKGILVAYSSIYGGTAEAANRLAEMLRRRNCGEIVTMDLSLTDQAEAVAQAFRLSAMVVAAPTYDAALYPPMHDFLHHLRLKNYRNRRVGMIENGSWAPIAAKLMREMLQPLQGIEIVEPVVTVRSRLNAANIDQLEALADAMASDPDTNV